MPQWELLVTQGHVRAARWRNAVPCVLSAGIAAVILGVAVSSFLPEAASSTRVMEAKNAFAAERRLAIATFLQDKGRITTPPENAEASFTREAASNSIQALMHSLNATGRLPENVITQRPDEFWAGAWQNSAIHAVRSDRTVLVGYFVDQMARDGANEQARPMLQRAYGLFRRNAQRQWSYHCLQVLGAQPCESDALDPAFIPATMRGLLPSSAFDRERSS
jgi:hypothetical protein